MQSRCKKKQKKDRNFPGFILSEKKYVSELMYLNVVMAFLFFIIFLFVFSPDLKSEVKEKEDIITHRIVNIIISTSFQQV